MKKHDENEMVNGRIYVTLKSNTAAGIPQQCVSTGLDVAVCELNVSELNSRMQKESCA